jgi:UDP-glucuronate decarboxylase
MTIKDRIIVTWQSEASEVKEVFGIMSEDIKKDTLKTLETNIYGTKNILELAKKIDVPVLYTSTVRVFENNHLSNVSSYTEGKKVSEILCNEYKKNVKIKIARLNNVYGVNMSINDSRVIPQFIMKCLKNENLIIYGDGTQQDSFCYIDDIIDILIKLMNSNITDTFNIGTSNISIIDLANFIINTLHSKSSIEFIQSESIFSRNNEIDIRLKEIFQWIPTIDLNNGILRTANYYKNKLNIS